jgi:hypothetical protein
MAAFGGMVAGSIGGCGTSDSDSPATPKPETPPAPATAEDPMPEKSATPVAQADMHVCRGLNACEGKGADRKNACAGQGVCATAVPHTCSGQNACKGQGGCGENPGQNECKGKGECAVPLMEAAWKKARAAFEAKMKEDKKEFGQPPAKTAK